jgi:hypothetical protein
MGKHLYWAPVLKFGPSLWIPRARLGPIPLFHRASPLCCTLLAFSPPCGPSRQIYLLPHRKQARPRWTEHVGSWLELHPPRPNPNGFPYLPRSARVVGRGLRDPLFYKPRHHGSFFNPEFVANNGCCKPLPGSSLWAGDDWFVWLDVLDFGCINNDRPCFFLTPFPSNRRRILSSSTKPKHRKPRRHHWFTEMRTVWPRFGARELPRCRAEVTMVDWCGSGAWGSTNLSPKSVKTTGARHGVVETLPQGRTQAHGRLGHGPGRRSKTFLEELMSESGWTVLKSCKPASAVAPPLPVCPLSSGLAES